LGGDGVIGGIGGGAGVAGADGGVDGPVCVTSVSGTVYDPAGAVPLHDAFVYSPTTPLNAIPSGASCDHCAGQVSGSPAATARSDALGHFQLTNVRPGTNIPLVIQIGKWRRESSIPTVAACVDNVITDASLTRLPRTQSEGNIPKIAVATGRADALECFVRKLGIADSEFTTSAGSGRVNLFVGGDPAPNGAGQGAVSFSPELGSAGFPPAATALWGTPAALMKYDAVVLSCEGSQLPTFKAPYLANVKAFADAGGRLVTGHLHYYWLRNGVAPWPSTATYLDPQPDVPGPISGIVDTTFSAGAAMADWLVGVGASTTRGTITMYGVQTDVASVNAPTRSWLRVPSNPASPISSVSQTMLTFDTPVEASAGAHCGRVAHVDLHVSSTDPAQNGKDSSSPLVPFPTGCRSTVMTAQERALEFVFFKLGACID
jgi:hypothetical protein